MAGAFPLCSNKVFELKKIIEGVRGNEMHRWERIAAGTSAESLFMTAAGKGFYYILMSLRIKQLEK